MRTVLLCTFACVSVFLAVAGCGGGAGPRGGESGAPSRAASSDTSSAAGDAPRDGSAAAVFATLPRGWSSLPAPPFSRARAVSVWTGRELFLWGGEANFGDDHYADGAAYDPVRGGWRALPPGPLAGRSGPAAVWTGTAVLIWGGQRDQVLGDGAAFNPAEGTWTSLAGSPLSPRVPVVAVWTGREMIVWGDASRSAAVRDGAAYDPADDRWRRLPPAPLALNFASATWTGEEMLVFGALLDGGNRSETKHAQGVAYDPEADRWRVIAPYPLSPQASSIAWTGSEMLAWDYELSAATYDPAHDRWRSLPDLPLRFAECYPASAEAGGIILAWYCGRGALFEIASGNWREIRPATGTVAGAPVAAGPVILFPGATHEGEANRLWAYRPASRG
jgi:hypothetical protein